MSITILGIDPGVNGALAFYSQDSLVIYDMPVLKRNKSTRVDNHALADIITTHVIEHAFIEQVNAFGMGKTSAYNFGWNCSAVETALTIYGRPLSYVTPQKWKKALQVPADKDGARARAGQLLPDYADQWPLKKHDGRAEAALIALWGYQTMGVYS